MPHENLCLPQVPTGLSPLIFLHTHSSLYSNCASPGGRVKRRASPDKEELGLTEPCAERFCSSLKVPIPLAVLFLHQTFHKEGRGCVSG